MALTPTLSRIAGEGEKGTAPPCPYTYPYAKRAALVPAIRPKTAPRVKPEPPG